MQKSNRTSYKWNFRQNFHVPSLSNILTVAIFAVTVSLVAAVSRTWKLSTSSIIASSLIPIEIVRTVPFPSPELN